MNAGCKGDDTAPDTEQTSRIKNVIDQV